MDALGTKTSHNAKIGSWTDKEKLETCAYSCKIARESSAASMMMDFIKKTLLRLRTRVQGIERDNSRREIGNEVDLIWKSVARPNNDPNRIDNTRTVMRSAVA